jgi:hypothetical protein
MDGIPVSFVEGGNFFSRGMAHLLELSTTTESVIVYYRFRHIRYDGCVFYHHSLL